MAQPSVDQTQFCRHGFLVSNEACAAAMTVFATILGHHLRACLN